MAHSILFADLKPYKKTQRRMGRKSEETENRSSRKALDAPHSYSEEMLGMAENQSVVGNEVAA